MMTYQNLLIVGQQCFLHLIEPLIDAAALWLLLIEALLE